MNKKIVIILIAMSILASGCGNQKVMKSNVKTAKDNKQIEQHVEEKEEVFFGQWIIKKQLAYGPVGTFSDEDIQKIIYKKLSFSREKASCFGDNIDYLNDVLENPTYKKSNLSKSDFESDNRVTFEKLDIKGDYITEVITNGSKDRGCVFYIKDNNTLILYGGGVYFQLNRV